MNASYRHWPVAYVHERRRGKKACLKGLFPDVPGQRKWPIISDACGPIVSMRATEVKNSFPPIEYFAF